MQIHKEEVSYHHWKLPVILVVSVGIFLSIEELWKASSSQYAFLFVDSIVTLSLCTTSYAGIWSFNQVSARMYISLLFFFLVPVFCQGQKSWIFPVLGSILQGRWTVLSDLGYFKGNNEIWGKLEQWGVWGGKKKLGMQSGFPLIPASSTV